MQQRKKHALTAFLFHAPGLKLLHNFELNLKGKIANGVALLLTFALALVAAKRGTFGSYGYSFFIAWVVGHFLWSSILALGFLSPLFLLGSIADSALAINKNKDKIQSMFGGISQSYDRLNDILTFGLHRRWKNNLVVWSEMNQDTCVLDCATGSGNVAFLFERGAVKPRRIVAIDACVPLLALARETARRINSNVEFIEADVLQLPFPNESFDIVSISFGLRNLSDMNAGLAEMKRVLKKGGMLFILESGKPEFLPIRVLWNFLFKFIIAPSGDFLSASKAYTYLYESSKSFPSGRELVDILHQTGLFAEVEYRAQSLGASYLYRTRT